MRYLTLAEALTIAEAVTGIDTRTLRSATRSWFAVRGFGNYDCEFRYRLDGYGSLGTGFGDDENVARLNDLFGEYLDHVHRPEAVLLKTRGTLQVVEAF